MIIEGPQDVTVYEGQSASFPCLYTGVNESPTWYIDEVVYITDMKIIFFKLSEICQTTQLFVRPLEFFVLTQIFLLAGLLKDTNQHCMHALSMSPFYVKKYDQIQCLYEIIKKKLILNYALSKPIVPSFQVELTRGRFSILISF